MKYIKLFEEITIQKNEFPKTGHGLSMREKIILEDLVGSEYLDMFTIKVEDHYYYCCYDDEDYFNKFDDFNDLKDYLLATGYINEYNPWDLLDLLKTSKLDPSFDNNRSIKFACDGVSLARLDIHIELLKLLLSDSRVDPSVDDNHCIKVLCRVKLYPQIVKVLLNDTRIDPSVDDNYCIEYAWRGGEKEIIKVLLNDERVRPKLSDKEINKYTNAIS